MVSVADVRLAINIDSEGDLSSDVITQAINRATIRVEAQVGRTATSDVIGEAILSLAAYLSYQTYSDRMLHKLEGTWGEDGHWDPVASVQIRETRDKLNALKTISDEVLALVTGPCLGAPPFLGTVKLGG